MLLQPKRPPGRADRKAAAYASEIARLRVEGYTYGAIREALAEVGIQLSESALRREMRRLQHVVPPFALAHVPTTTRDLLTRPGTQKQATGPPSAPDKCGRDIAEAFFDAHSSNPLFPTKDPP